MNTPLTALELAWQRTLREWQIRATVEECLQEMVQDIDVANRLEEQLRTTEEVSQLKRQVLEYEIALEEARAVQNQTTQSQRELADRLVRELWTLSQRIGQWKTTEEKYDRMLIQYDETVARMLQLEDDLQDAKQQVQSLGALTQQENPTPLTAPSTTATITTAATAVIGATQAPGTASSTTEPMVLDNAAAATTPTPITQTESEPKTTIPTESNVVESNIEIMAPPRQPAATIVAIPETPPRDNPDNNNNNNNAKTKGIETNLPSSTNEPAAVLVEEDSSESPPGLETLDNKTLMVVFAYLDALDILNTAQINISMYSRVDTLFGLGGHHDTSGDGDNSTIATNDTAFHHTASTHTEPASSLPPPPRPRHCNRKHSHKHRSGRELPQRPTLICPRIAHTHQLGRQRQLLPPPPPPQPQLHHRPSLPQPHNPDHPMFVRGAIPVSLAQYWVAPPVVLEEVQWQPVRGFVIFLICWHNRVGPNPTQRFHDWVGPDHHRVFIEMPHPSPPIPHPP